MRKLLSAGVAALAMLAAAATGAFADDDDDDGGRHKSRNDGNACYQNRGPEDWQYVRYLATRQGDLITKKERRNFGHPAQTTYTVHGKSTETAERERFIGIVNGTAIVGKRTGAVIRFTRDFLGVDFSDINDCVSANGEASATPETWVCNLIIVDPNNAQEVRPVPAGNPPPLGTRIFDRVDAKDTPQCSDFSIPLLDGDGAEILQ